MIPKKRLTNSESTNHSWPLHHGLRVIYSLLYASLLNTFIVGNRHLQFMASSGPRRNVPPPWGLDKPEDFQQPLVARQPSFERSSNDSLFLKNWNQPTQHQVPFNDTGRTRDSSLPDLFGLAREYMTPALDGRNIHSKRTTSTVDSNPWEGVLGELLLITPKWQ